MKYPALFATLALFASAANAQASPENWIVAGVTLGDNYEDLFKTFDKSKAIIETKGFSTEHNIETSRQIWFYKEGAKDKPVDVIRQYHFQIRDGQVYITGEADGEGRITFMRFRQKAEGSGEARLAQLTDRYGPFRQNLSGTYQWGCEELYAPCLEGEPSDYQLQVTMRHKAAELEWNSKYRTMMSAAKGESTQDRF